MEQERKPQNKGLRIAAGVVFALLCAAQIAYLAVSLRYEWSLAAFPSARRVLLQTGIRQLFPILIHAFLAIRMFAREQIRLSLPAGIACAAVFVLSAVGLFAFQTFRYDSAPALLYVVKHVLPVLIFALVAALWLFSRKASFVGVAFLGLAGEALVTALYYVAHLYLGYAVYAGTAAAAAVSAVALILAAVAFLCPDSKHSALVRRLVVTAVILLLLCAVRALAVLIFARNAARDDYRTFLARWNTIAAFLLPAGVALAQLARRTSDE